MSSFLARLLILPEVDETTRLGMLGLCNDIIQQRPKE
jgi:hypothetical protein